MDVATSTPPRCVHQRRPSVLRALLAHLDDLRELLCVLAEHQATIGVLEDVLALLRGIAVVDRSYDRAGAESAKVGQRPFRTRAGEDRDAVARMYAKGDQTTRDFAQAVANSAYESSAHRPSRQKRKALPSCTAVLRRTISGSVRASVAWPLLRGAVTALETAIAAMNSIRIAGSCSSAPRGSSGRTPTIGCGETLRCECRSSGSQAHGDRLAALANAPVCGLAPG